MIGYDSKELAKTVTYIYVGLWLKSAKTSIWGIYGHEYCSFQSAALKASMLSKHATDSGREFHWIIVREKKEIFF